MIIDRLRTLVGCAILAAVAPLPTPAAPFPLAHFIVLPALEVDIGEGVYDGPGLHAFALADLNGDGRLDLVTVEADDDRVEVWVGRADASGALDPVGRFDTDVSTPTAVVVADVGSPFASDAEGAPDGRPDVIVGGLFDVDILLGRGDGQFDPPEQEIDDTFDLAWVVGLVAQDFDGQPSTDLAVLDEGGVVTFMCNSDGNLQPCDVARIELADSSEPIDIVAGDFDGDGHRDVAVLDRDEASVTAIFGNGDGTFDVPEQATSVRGEGEMSSDLAVGRLDGNLLDDLAVINYGEFGENLGATLLGRPDGRFSPTLFVAPFDANALALADFSGWTDGQPDGSLDAVVGADVTTLQLNDGLGSLAEPYALLSPARLPPPAMIVAGDIGGDPRADFVALDTQGRTVHVVLNQTQSPPPPPPPCAGDCDGSGEVSITDLLNAVGSALRPPSLIWCRKADVDGSGRVTITELIAAVHAALGGCPE